jgi:arsenate reductase (glutaredoxin)
MRQPTIYHNPRCSKSRATLELLRERGYAPRIVEYIQTPPSPAEIERLLALLGLEPRDVMRRDESEYADLGLGDTKLTRRQLVAAIAAHPKLLQRPIVVAGGRAAIGRPPEAVLAILAD